MTWALGVDYVEALALPVVVMVLGIVFRRQLVGVARRVQSIDTPFGGVSFDQQAQEVDRETVAAVESQQQAAHSSAEPGRPLNPEREEADYMGETSRRFSDLRVQARRDPTAAVLGG